MKISLITLHKVLNYGSVLQTYATSELFKQFGCEVEVIDYVRKKDLDEDKLRDFTEYRLQLKGKKIDTKIKRIVYSIIYNNFLYKSTAKFFFVCSDFLNKNIQLTKDKYTTKEMLWKSPPIADVYCVGSDQVWNPIHNEGLETPYYLDFVNNGHRISFASSLGLENLSTEQKEQIMPYLSSFDAISTREKQTMELFNKFGLDVEHIIDPTMLLSKEKWEDLIVERQIKNKYLLVYQFGNSDKINNIAYKIAFEKGLEVVHIGFHKHQKLKKKGKFILVPSVNEFLSLFYYADFIVTNSFHGTCFSINFNKNFIVILRDKFNIRMKSILESVGLMERIITDENNISIGMKEINYNNVQKDLDIIRANDIKWLENQLNNIKFNKKE